MLGFAVCLKQGIGQLDMHCLENWLYKCYVL